MRHWFGLADGAQGEALYDSHARRDLASIELSRESMPDAATLVKLRRLPEDGWPAQSLLDETSAHLSEDGLEIHQALKGSQWHFGMKARIGVGSDAGLVHGFASTAASVNDVARAAALPPGQGATAFGDAGHPGVDEREEAKGSTWRVAEQAGKFRTLDKVNICREFLEGAGRFKASARVKAERQIRVLTSLLCLRTDRCRRLPKNQAHLVALLGLANRVIAKSVLLGAHGAGAS